MSADESVVIKMVQLSTVKVTSFTLAAVTRLLICIANCVTKMNAIRTVRSNEKNMPKDPAAQKLKKAEVACHTIKSWP